MSQPKHPLPQENPAEECNMTQKLTRIKKIMWSKVRVVPQAGPPTGGEPGQPVKKLK